jgi:hypothetical protein
MKYWLFYILVIFGPTGEKVIGRWKKLHNVKLHNVYSSPYVIRVMRLRR